MSSAEAPRLRRSPRPSCPNCARGSGGEGGREGLPGRRGARGVRGRGAGGVHTALFPQHLTARLPANTTQLWPDPARRRTTSTVSPVDTVRAGSFARDVGTGGARVEGSWSRRGLFGRAGSRERGGAAGGRGAPAARYSMVPSAHADPPAIATTRATRCRKDPRPEGPNMLSRGPQPSPGGPARDHARLRRAALPGPVARRVCPGPGAGGPSSRGRATPGADLPHYC